MAIVNTANFGVVTGRLTKDPVTFDNKDKSKKVMVTVAVQDSFKNHDGERKTQFINLEGFISNKTEGEGVYGYMHKGDLVQISFGVRTNNYTAKDGKPVYDQVLAISGVQLMESKKAQAERAVKAAAKAAEESEQPF